MKKSCLCMIMAFVLFAQLASAQLQSNNTLDPSTQRTLEDLNRLLLNGTEQQIQNKIEEIISSSGYVKPLARVFYRLAQNEDNGSKVAQHYQSIIQNWPESAWCQKAVIEFIPLYLMSDGELGPEVEAMIWSHMRAIMNPAEDAPSIGEDPELLVQEVQKQLISLAYYRDNLNSLKTLQENANQFQDQIILMMAFDAIEKQQLQTARNQIRAWLTANQNSSLLPIAYLGLFRSAESQQMRAEIAAQMTQKFPNALETKIITAQAQ